MRGEGDGEEAFDAVLMDKDEVGVGEGEGGWGGEGEAIAE